MKPSAAWLICYDVAEPRRLGRVHRATIRFAIQVQYSVYWARLDRYGLNAALASLARLIHPRQDDVRFYPLPENLVSFAIGRAAFPDGVRLSAPGLERLIAGDAVLP